MKSTDEKRQWLKNLRAGSKVAIRNFRGGFGCEYQIATVDKVTKQGRDGTIIIRKRRYNGGTGAERGPSYTRGHLVPITDEVRRTIRRYKNEARIHSTKWHELPDETINKIAAILRGVE